MPFCDCLTFKFFTIRLFCRLKTHLLHCFDRHSKRNLSSSGRKATISSVKSSPNLSIESFGYPLTATILEVPTLLLTLFVLSFVSSFAFLQVFASILRQLLYLLFVS